jgi:hypothetical protein
VFVVGGHTDYPDYSGNFGRGYALSIGRGEGPPWLMFQQNYHRSSSLCQPATNSVRLLADGSVPKMDLYPLPVRDELRIESPGMRRCVILDAAGRIVAEVQDLHDAATVDVASLPRGIYFLLAEGDGVPVVRSFLRF